MAKRKKAPYAALMSTRIGNVVKTKPVFSAAEMGRYEGVSFVKVERNPHATDLQQRFMFAVTALVMPVTVALSSGYAAFLAAGVGLLLLSGFWLLECGIQRAEVERFAEALAPEDELADFPRAQWSKEMMASSNRVSLVGRLFGAQMAKNIQTGNKLLAMLRAGESATPVTHTSTSAIPRK